MPDARFQLNTYVDAGTFDAVRTKALELGVTQGALIALYVRHAERTMTAEALAKWASAHASGRSRAQGPLVAVERNALNAIGQMMRERAPQVAFTAAELQAVSPHPPRETFRGARGLAARGLAEVSEGTELDRWGRAKNWNIRLTEKGRLLAGAPDAAERQALGEQLRERERKSAEFMASLAPPAPVAPPAPTPALPPMVRDPQLQVPVAGEEELFSGVDADQEGNRL